MDEKAQDIVVAKAETGLLDRVLSSLGLERKSAPLYQQPYSTSVSDSMRWTGWGWNRNRFGTNIDYVNEVGRLDESSLVMAVVNWTATQLPEANPVVQRPGKDGALEPDWGNPAADIIRRPNPFSVWANECGALSVSWWIDGNCYFFKSRDATGAVQDLWYLPHFLVKERWPNDGCSPDVPTSGPNKAENNYLSHYEYRVPGKDPILYRADDVIHIRRGKNINNPRCGIGAFDSVIREIYGDNKAALFAATILKNMGIVVPIMSPKDKDISIDPTQAAALKEQWIQGTTGDNIGKPLIQTIPVDVTKFAFSPQEIDLKELRKVPESRIAAVTGIPAPMLQFLVGLENGTSYAAYAEARRQGYESVIIPIQAAIAEQLTWQLLPDFDNTKGAKFVFDVSNVRVLQEDRDALYKRAADALRAGGTSRNQFMASLGKPPVDKEEIYYVPIASAPMTAEKIAELATDMTPPPVPPPIDPASLAKFAEMERWFEGLEISSTLGS